MRKKQRTLTMLRRWKHGGKYARTNFPPGQRKPPVHRLTGRGVSRYRGVTWSRAAGKWMAQIRVHGTHRADGAPAGRVGTPLMRVAGIAAPPPLPLSPVSDFGWTFNQAGDQWELLGIHGELVWRVTAEYVDRVGAAAVNAKGAKLGNRWPELIPGRPYIQCVLADGPLAGCYHYLDPREQDGPPETLCIGLEQPLPGMPDGPGPDIAVRVRPLVYRKARQGCGHGSDCPWPYAYQAPS